MHIPHGDKDFFFFTYDTVALYLQCCRTLGRCIISVLYPSPHWFSLQLCDIHVRSPSAALYVCGRLIAGHLLWVVNWTPQEESYQHNRNPFSDICHILWTQPALVSAFERGSRRLCLLFLKIRAGVGANYEEQRQPGTAGHRGWMRCVWKGNYQYRIRRSGRQQLPAGYWLITGKIKELFRMLLSSSHLQRPQR